jgi:glycosyltransferase involved in cell wall biosynthesis
MILVSQPTANQNTRAALRGLSRAGLLGGFSTTIAFGEALCNIVPARVASVLRRRSFPEVQDSPIYQNPFPELWRAAGLRLPAYIKRSMGGAHTGSTDIYNRHDRFTANLVPRIESIRGVYSLAGGARHTFISAKARGFAAVLEQPIAYATYLSTALSHEAMSNPDWYNPWNVPDEAGIVTYEGELASADLVIAPSKFVKDSLPQKITSAPVVIVPYGMPEAADSHRTFDGAEPLKVLFVGGLDCRKGIKYAVEAVEKLGKAATLTIIGVPPKNAPRRLAAALSRHRYIFSAPHHAILGEMAQHDVLVLPSLAEGMALVVGEALAVGLPVIVTAQCGVEAWVQDGVNGIFIRSQDADALATQLARLIDEPDRIEQMSRAGLKSVRKWFDYEQELVGHIVGVLTGHARAPQLLTRPVRTCAT